MNDKSENPQTAATILVVDDEPVNLSILTQALEPYYQVLVATSGERALHLASGSTPPDLILLDIMMPEMDGHAVLGLLRGNPDTAEIPVIFVTSLSASSEEMLGLELGANDYIHKPINPGVLLARVRTQLELKQAKDRIKGENVWLEQEVASRLREIQLVQDVSLTALAELAETRDSETGHHIQRTQEYVRLLADQLVADDDFDLDDHQAGLAVKAAPLHDLGKVGIPDSILLKPGRLTPEEFEIMKTHSQIGADAIEHALQRASAVHDNVSDAHGEHALEFLRQAKIIALNHHERWDGAGYPQGLSGEKIPLPGRLMALADVFDALISKRVYKGAMSPDEARDIINQGDGTQFDPRIVAIFNERFAEFVQIAERLKD